jgi:hypothetical protein
MNDLKNIWQNQSRELQNVSLNQLREQLRHMHRKMRLQTAFRSGVGLVILDFFVRRFISAKDLIERIGWGLPIVGSLCLVVPLIYENHKMRLSGNLSFNAGLTTCLTFYRKTLERQRILGRRWLFSLGTILLFAGLVALLVRPIQWTYRHLQEPGSPNLLSWIPFLIILALWGISFMVLRRRRRAWLQREFENLEALEKENQ